MAITAHSLPHFNIGLLLEDDCSDDETTDLNLDSNNDNHSSQAYQELNLGLIFQRSLSIDLSRMCQHQQAEDVSNSNSNGNMAQNRETSENTSISEHDAVPENKIETDRTAESSDIDNGVVVEQSKNDDVNVNVSSGVVTESIGEKSSAEENASENNDKWQAQWELEAVSIFSVCHSYGNQRKRLSKTEKLQRKEMRRKVRRHIDPSEIGFDFCRSRQLVFQTDANATETSDGEDKTVDVTSEKECLESVLPSKTLPSERSMSLADNEQNMKTDNGDESGITEPTQLQDDESFFADLGIDIHDNGSFDWDDCLDWDDTSLTPLKSKSEPVPSSTKSKSNNVKSNKDTKDNKLVAIVDACLEFEYSTPNYRMSTSEQTLLFTLECTSSSKVYLRKDKDRKIERLQKAVKTTHFLSKNFANNRGGRKINANYRILKKTEIDIDFRTFRRYSPPAMPKAGVDLKVARAIRIRNPPSPRREKGAPKQNLRHVLHETNLPQAIEHDLASFLLSIQNRDLTPEDYEMLLRLDDSVKAKTVSTNIVSHLKTDTVEEDIANILNCVICMEPYLVGQTRKFLPCDHDFHADCIDSWLINNSQNCPLDGLPIGDS